MPEAKAKTKPRPPRNMVKVADSVYVRRDLLPCLTWHAYGYPAKPVPALRGVSVSTGEVHWPLRGEDA